VAESLREIGMNSASAMFATYTGRKDDLGQWTAGADINKDNNLRLSYLAGWGINSQLADYIYRQMMRYRKVPTDIFTGSPETVTPLLGAIAGQRR